MAPHDPDRESRKIHVGPRPQLGTSTNRPCVPPRIATQREQIETSRRLPEDLARDLAQAGCFRISLPSLWRPRPHADPGAGDLRGTRAGRRLSRMVRLERQHALDGRPTNTGRRTHHPRRPRRHYRQQHASLGTPRSRPRRIPGNRPLVARQRLRTRRLDGAVMRRP